jgi:hypothetical protein
MGMGKKKAYSSPGSPEFLSRRFLCQASACIQVCALSSRLFGTAWSSTTRWHTRRCVSCLFKYFCTSKASKAACVPRLAQREHLSFGCGAPHAHRLSLPSPASLASATCWWPSLPDFLVVCTILTSAGDEDESRTSRFFAREVCKDSLPDFLGVSTTTS